MLIKVSALIFFSFLVSFPLSSNAQTFLDFEEYPVGSLQNIKVPQFNPRTSLFGYIIQDCGLACEGQGKLFKFGGFGQSFLGSVTKAIDSISFKTVNLAVTPRTITVAALYSSFDEDSEGRPRFYQTEATNVRHENAPVQHSFPSKAGFYIMTVTIEPQVINATTLVAIDDLAVNYQVEPPKVNLSVASVEVLDLEITPDGVGSVVPGKEFILKATLGADMLKPNEDRDATLRIQAGAKLYEQQVLLNSFSKAGAQEVFVPIEFSIEDAGTADILITLNEGRNPEEADYSDNSFSSKVHVLCSVETDSKKLIPFRQNGEWGRDQYDHLPGQIMKNLGCLTTNFAALFNFYGFNIARDGQLMTPRSLNNGLKAQNFYSGDLAEWNGYTPGGGVQLNGVALYGRSAFATSCVAAGGSSESCAIQSLSAVSYKGTNDSFGEVQRKLVNRQLCEGNPVILKVRSMSDPTSQTRKHFVLAKAMSVNASGEHIYFVNNPGLINPERGIEDAAFVQGYRLYKQAADPSMIFVHLTGGAEMLVTDPNGKRTGFDPLRQESYREISGSAYTRAEAISSPDDSLISSPLESVFQGLEPLNGRYVVEIFSAVPGSFKLTQYSYDESGNINYARSENIFVGASGSATLALNHASASIQRTFVNLSIANAVFDSQPNSERAHVTGKIDLANPILEITQLVTISIGQVGIQISPTELKKTYQDGKLTLKYNQWGSRGVKLTLDPLSGVFELEFKRTLIGNLNGLFTTNVGFNINEVFAESLVTFRPSTKGDYGN